MPLTLNDHGENELWMTKVKMYFEWPRWKWTLNDQDENELWMNKKSNASVTSLKTLMTHILLN